jgi:hypothetical protein
LSVSDAGFEQLQARSADVAADGAWRVAAFRSIDEAAKLIDNLEQKHELEVVSGERLTAGLGRPISFWAGDKPEQLRVRFAPEWLANNKLSVRVNERLGASNGPEAQLPDVSSFLVEGLANNPAGQNAVEQLFPGRSWDHKHLVIFVSARAIPQASPEAVARTDRRR